MRPTINLNLPHDAELKSLPVNSFIEDCMIVYSLLILFFSYILLVLDVPSATMSAFLNTVEANVSTDCCTYVIAVLRKEYSMATPGYADRLVGDLEWYSSRVLCDSFAADFNFNYTPIASCYESKIVFLRNFVDQFITFLIQ